jgi:hypothetical protein
MKNSEYNYSKAGKPATWNEESYAFAGERFTDILMLAEESRQVNAAARPAGSSKSKVALQLISVVLSCKNFFKALPKLAAHQV